MKDRVLRCYVRGHNNRWEAVCVDFDIAVEGASRPDVARALEEAVINYVHTAISEDEATAKRLLNRRAPFWVRWPIMWSAALHTLVGSRSTHDLRGTFDLACPA